MVYVFFWEKIKYKHVFKEWALGIFFGYGHFLRRGGEGVLHSLFMKGPDFFLSYVSEDSMEK